MAPTAKKREAMAAPNVPVSGSRARMDHVMAAPSRAPLRAASGVLQPRLDRRI
jgi:hypothetical protein